MKKLAFLLPIAMWIGVYFIWKLSGPYFSDTNPMWQTLWWYFTDFISLALTLLSVVFAIAINQ